nr:immunoglobulin light chain junction region [Macaca mulatta]
CSVWDSSLSTRVF